MADPADSVRAPSAPKSAPDTTTGGCSPCEATPAPGSVGRYALREEIARGGMGAVYRAADTTLDREVAVKVLQDRFPAVSAAARRFADEARITAQLQHPGVPPVHDLGALPDGRPFLVMKLINGSTLEDLLKARPAPGHDRGRFVAAFEQVCQAVAYAHGHGVIHRDLKPANVMVGAYAEVQVMDWGLAKVLANREGERPEDDPEKTTAGTEALRQREGDGPLTHPGSVLGTPAYMPPEQAIGAVDQVDARSDVFGLGGILAAVLTGRPPFVGGGEAARQLAALGKVQECFERLDACGADPELVALCKRCLAPEKANRPSDASEVAKAVAGLRAAADERARRAELERVKVEGERASAEARAVERRRRRRLWVGSAAALGAAVLAGLSAVLAVQARANRDLEAKNEELAREQERVEERFELARKAVAAYHTGVSEDVLLKKDQFKELRTRLLREAAGFYADLEKLLAGQGDAKSRGLLAEGYSQLGDLTEKIGDKAQALAVHHKALSLRRELAAEPGADAEARLAVARALQWVGGVLRTTGDPAGALRAFEEMRDVAGALVAETDAAPSVLADGHNHIGILLAQMGKPAEALAAFQKARDIQQRLADANLAGTRLHSRLAASHNNIGILLAQAGKTAEALAAFQKAMTLRQGLVDANPTVSEFQEQLANSHNNIGVLLAQTNKPAESLAAHQRALAVLQKLADANPAVTEFQSALATTYNNVGVRLAGTGKLEEALLAYEKAVAIQGGVSDANPTVTTFRSRLAETLGNLGSLLTQTGKPAEALAAHQRALAVLQKLADANPAVTEFQSALATSRNLTGRMLARLGRFPEAFAALDGGLALRQKLADADPRTPRFTNHLAYSHAYRGWARVRAGQLKEAATDLRRTLDLWAVEKAPNADTRFELARALALLAGLSRDAKSGVNAGEAKAFADRAIAALQDAVTAGWTQPTELKEPDFDAVRGREEFQKLAKGLEAKAATSPAAGAK